MRLKTPLAQKLASLLASALALAIATPATCLANTDWINEGAQPPAKGESRHAPEDETAPAPQHKTPRWITGDDSAPAKSSPLHDTANDASPPAQHKTPHWINADDSATAKGNSLHDTAHDAPHPQHHNTPHWINGGDGASGKSEKTHVPTNTTQHHYKGESTTGGGTLLKGGLNYCVPSGTPIKLKIATVPTYGMRLAQRNMDGELHPAKLNEVITAKVTEDIFVDNNKVIPVGTVFHGRVSHILPPKRVGQPGSLVLSFDQFTTPDGRKFAFRAEANNKKESTVKTKTKRFGMVMAHGAGGAAVGAIVAYSLFGLEQTIAMHGYNIAGGAAAGALMGTAYALIKKGNLAVLEPGEDLNMEIDTDLLVPAATTPTAKAPATNFPGLQMKINKVKVKKDGLGGHELFVDMTVLNNTNNRLNSIDLHLEDDNGVKYPLVAGGDNDFTETLFSVDPYSDQHLRLAFQVEYPKMKHTLIWLDHKSRNILYRVKIQ